MEDWDLQAVVRGHNTSEVFASIMNKQPQFMFATSDFDQDDDPFGNLTKSFEPNREDRHLYGLEGLYRCKPSFPESLLTTTASSTSPPIREEKKEPPPELQKSPEEQPLSESSESRVSSVSCSTNQFPHATKWKRSRKNDQKKVVQQVAAGSLSSDMWAWRKYGQKPIKGSPYPRSYYRCSSLKGCIARKQVERSIPDPSIFIVSYTNEHSHRYPPRRNALAGSTRSSKSLVTSKKVIASNEPKLLDPTSEESPETPPLASTFSINEDEFFQPKANRDRKEEQAMLPEEIGDQMLFPDNMFSDDDFYPNLGDFESLLFD